LPRPGSRSYERYPDEYIVELGKQGDTAAVDYLLKKYKSVVLFKSRSYFLQGADRDDMIQEGMIGLFKAIRDFRPDRSCSFRTFADVCITRQMITAVKSGSSQRQLPLVYQTSLGGGSREEGGQDILDVPAPSEETDPERLLISRETVRELKQSLRENLSDFEWSVFLGFSQGKSYQEIADEHGSTPKSVDNALCRVRRKVQKFKMGEHLGF